ncbi:MAG: hypothetical protein IMF05_16235 [Proteobacteria bacterium]|nr:hypothetical protein [Pseudomonadota bacterium]
MTSEVAICNAALAKVSNNRIASLSEGSTAGDLCNEMYERIRDRLLRRHIWNFNKKRVKLGQLAQAPVFGWTYAYQLPSDWVRNIAIYPDPAGINPTHDYEVEGRTIAADHADIYLVYGARITDPNDFDEMFREALAYALAVELAVPLAKSATLRDRMNEAFQAYVMEAQTIDGQDDPPDYAPEPGWATVRN